jgi:hypothetical protein
MPGGSIVVLIASAALLLAGAGTEPNPKFVSTSVSTDNLEVEVAWKETGLWPEVEMHYVVVAEARATYVCVEAGQPAMSDRQDVYDLVSAEGDFTATKKGISSGKLALKPPGPGMYSCSPGQQLKIACVAYSAVSCKDERYALSSELRRTIVLFQPGYGKFCDLDLR